MEVLKLPSKMFEKATPKTHGWIGRPQITWVLFGKRKKLLPPPLTFFKNNQFQNILTLYHINNFLLLFKLKKFITIQNFFTFPYKFFLLNITFITSYYYSQLPLPYQTRPWGWWPFLLFFYSFFFSKFLI